METGFGPAVWQQRLCANRHAILLLFGLLCLNITAVVPPRVALGRSALLERVWMETATQEGAPASWVFSSGLSLALRGLDEDSPMAMAMLSASPHNLTQANREPDCISDPGLEIHISSLIFFMFGL